MTTVIDYRRDPSAWLAFVNEIDSLVQKLPDGAQRRTRFEHEMRFSDCPDDYLLTSVGEMGGVPVYRTGPGPKAVAFRDALRAALEGGAV